jgi:hypothetical protein
MKLPVILKGDVFSLVVHSGIGLIQCVRESSMKESETIRVISGIFQIEKVPTIDQLSNGKELFFTTLSLKYALKKKLIKYIVNFPVPMGAGSPKFYRDKHFIGSTFIGWHIVNADTLQRRLVKELSEEERKLSPWGMTSIPDIAERIENNWSPENWI